MPSLMKVHNKKYYINKAAINRRNNRQTAYRIQQYNNFKVDELILHQNDNEYIKPTHSMLYADLEVLTRPQVYNNYNKLIQSPYIKNDTVQQMLIRNKANKEVDRIVTMELERVTNNLNYVENVLKKYDVPKKEYQRLLDQQKNNSINNRRQLFEQVAYQANEVSRATGLDIKMPQPYMNLDTFTENLMRQQSMTSEWELKQEESRNGANYTKKKWIHTGAGKTTRHTSNHMQEVNFNDTFVILNDVTGDIDEIDYPCDPNGSPSNCAICYCEFQCY